MLNPNITLGASATFDDNYTYFITISPIRKKDYVTHETLEEAYALFLKLCPYITIYKKVYELDNKYFSLHLHAFIGSCNNIYFRPLIKKFTSQFKSQLFYKKVYNIKGLLKYMNKQSKNQYEEQNMITTHTYCHPNADNKFE